MTNVLHLTHTDINSDSRILKEMKCLANISDDYKVRGLGIELSEERHKTATYEKIEVLSIQLKSRAWRFLPTVLRHMLSFIELFLKMVFKAIKFKPDIIHCHDTMVLPLGVIVKIFTNSKLIYDAHELESNKNSSNKNLGKITFILEKILWNSVDKLIVVSPSIANWYKDNLGEKDTEIIMNSPMLDENVELKNKDYFRNKYSIPDTSKIFLYIGILGRGRGIELILDTFKNNQDLSAHLVFLGYGEFKDKLIEDSQIYKNIHVHDAVPHQEVVTIARSADVGLCLIENVSLSDYYCLPNKLFEYAFAEIPILASNFPDIKSVIDKYKLGKYSELSESSIYEAIKAFEKESIVINSSNLYELSWQAQEAKLINLYNDIK